MALFFDHSRHKLRILTLDAHLDVLAFHGEEQLSKPFTYTVEFTCTEKDLAVAQVLGEIASFSLFAVPDKTPIYFGKRPEAKPLRTFHGYITGFRRLSASADEARYAVTLQPTLARLGIGQQYRIYQQQSVPQIVESILRSRHEFLGQHFLFKLAREYPRREQVMQYGESDLAFIERLLAEVGIWYRIVTDQRLSIDVVEFHDDQRHYEFDISLPLRTPSGLNSNSQDAAWQLQSAHQVVEKTINFRSYDYRDAYAFMDGDVDHSRRNPTLYGEAHHYAEPYRELGHRFDRDEHLACESGFFFARLAHERYLNDHTRLSGVSSSAALATAQVLTITGGAPQAFANGIVITRLTTRAARDASFEAHFEAIPYSLDVCFRPHLLPKPQMAGSVPARVTSDVKNDRYANIDKYGRYKVNFLFNRDTWKLGEESLWLRLARPYAGDKHGSHFPLIVGTEVAIAFEQGDPDRPYIAHALHDDYNPDHVTLYNYKRNVLRTPANKLRMDDERGKEHVKLSTEYAGKSQLNLGHLVDSQKKQRGEGAELRTDGWGVFRAGKGVFISADEQAAAQGDVLDMEAAVVQLESALSLARSLAAAARNGQALPSDVESQAQLNRALDRLAQPGALLHAPAGIGLVSPQAICVASGAESVGIMAAHNTDISAGRNITATAEGAVSVFAQSAGLQLKAAQGKVELHAADNSLHAMAKTDIKIESVQGRVEISAPQELLLSCGGAYIRLKGGDIEIGAPGNIYHKAAHVEKLAAASITTPPRVLPAGYSATYSLNELAHAPRPFTRYRITSALGEIFNGVTDRDGYTMTAHTALPGELQIEFPEAAVYDEQLRFVGPEGEVVANVRYTITLGDGSTLEGVTDEQGSTQRFLTKEPTGVTKVGLFPPEDPSSRWGQAGDAQPMMVDLTARDINTTEAGVGSSVEVIPLSNGQTRGLTSGEIAMARTLFKDSIDYGKVKVHRGGWWLFFGFQNTAVTPNGEMYFPETTGWYRDDYSSVAFDQMRALFIHELTHVWQYQLGYPVKLKGLTVTSRGAAVYQYRLSVGASLSDFNMEQQGEIISDYYMICVMQRPDAVWNEGNETKDPVLLRSLLRDFLENPHSRSHLPEGKKI